MPKESRLKGREASKNAALLVEAESVVGKYLPSNTQAERAVLGALLLHDDQMHIIAERLRAEDFYNISHKIIFQAMLDLAHSQKRIDLVTLQDLLSKENQLELVGGVGYLIELQGDIPAIGMIEQHATIIKEKAILRDLIKSAASIISNCYSQDEENISMVLDHAEKTIFEISNRRSENNFVQIDIWLKKTFQ